MTKTKSNDINQSTMHVPCTRIAIVCLLLCTSWIFTPSLLLLLWIKFKSSCGSVACLPSSNKTTKTKGVFLLLYCEVLPWPNFMFARGLRSINDEFFFMFMAQLMKNWNYKMSLNLISFSCVFLFSVIQNDTGFLH